VNETATSGIVQLVATPIGNLGDITFRAVEAIRAADVVACEDTRHSRRLLEHLGIRPREMVALHEHNERIRAEDLARRAAEGARIVSLSDAGMPGISDPGYRLVKAALAAGVRVEALPGPCALVTALAASGLPTDAFHFGGFLPVKSGRRAKAIEEALARRETSIFYESPHRIAATLALLRERAPDREVCVARELTKRFETYHRGSASALCEEFAAKPTKGEITLLIRGAGKSGGDGAGADSCDSCGA
jgi:16S rRNA (cytidine1402-2'-O)-methyltransferase